MNKEIRKQLIDQHLHVGMSIASVWVINWVTSNLWLAMFLTFAWGAVREVRQWPPRPTAKWDPPLDWFFECVGIFLGYLICK